jgi:hypothetical protein
MALGMGVVFFVLAFISFVKGSPVKAEKLSIVAACITAIGIVYPRLLLPFEKLLRNLVLGLAWLNTKVMLVLVYYLVFAPMGFVLKLFGKKLLTTEFKEERESYFDPRPEEDYKPERDELQF